MSDPYEYVPARTVAKYLQAFPDDAPFISFAGPRPVPEGLTATEAVEDAILTGVPLPPPPDYIEGDIY